MKSINALRWIYKNHKYYAEINNSYKKICQNEILIKIRNILYIIKNGHPNAVAYKEYPKYHFDNRY